MEARALSVLLFIAGLLTAAPTLAADKALDRSFDVSAGGRLNVKLDAGHIVVSGTDAQRVVVRLRAEGASKEIERLTWSAEKDAAGVSITSRRGGENGWFRWNDDIRVTASIEVPRDYNVELNTSGGNIELRNLSGDAAGKTSGGRIVVESAQGKVQMRTSGGGIMLKSLTGDVEVHTSGGSIQASQLPNGLRAHTSGGNIRLEQVGGAIDVHTSGGAIDVDFAGENRGIVARTSGGSVTLRLPSSVNASLDASTSGGRVKSDVPMTTTESGDRTLRGTINGGGPEIVARSSGGSVQILRKD